MKKLLVLFSHKLTKEQIEDSTNNLKVNEIITLPEDLQKIWSNVSPYLDNKALLKEIHDFITKKLSSEDYALVQGEWGYVYDTVNFCKENNIIPIYATTERVVSESTQEDGTIEKTSIFKHVMFKRY